MGWKGAVRSMAASARRAEREAERRRKQYAKEQMIEDAADAVAEWQERIREIVSLHVDPTDDMDWRAVLRKPEPQEPSRSNDRETDAVAALNAFQPGFFDFLWGGAERRRAKLEQAVVDGRRADEQTYQEALSSYRSEHAEWKADTALAKRLLGGEMGAQREVIAEMQSLSEDGLIGTHLSFRLSDEFLHAIAHVHGDEVVPKVRRKQLQSGRLSESKMPAGEANELYQDYVCSVALRVAGDLFGLLPRDEVYVTCVTRMLDRATGHQAETPILSVRFVRDTFRRLSLGRIDPSDSMRNFAHEMSFKRTTGFSPVHALQPLAE
jgi:hypothetical protein